MYSIVLWIIVVLLLYRLSKRAQFIPISDGKQRLLMTIRCFQGVANFKQDLRLFTQNNQQIYLIRKQFSDKCLIYFHGGRSHCMYRRSMISLLYNYGSVMACDYQYRGKELVNPKMMLDLAIKQGYRYDQICIIGETISCEFAVDLSNNYPHHSLLLIMPKKYYRINNPDRCMILHAPDKIPQKTQHRCLVNGNDNAIIVSDYCIYEISRFFDGLSQLYVTDNVSHK